MSQHSSPVESLMSRVRNRPWVSSLIALGTVVIALSTFTDAARNLWHLVRQQSPEEARVALSRLSLNYSPEMFLRKAKEGDRVAVKLFLAAGMDPNASDGDGNTALSLAASNGHAAVVQALLDGKADVNRRWGSGATALASAAYRGAKSDVLRVLVEAGADAKSMEDATHAAAMGGNREALSFLLERKPQLAQTLYGGDTLLINAVQSSDLELVKAVVARGVSVTDKGAQGLTALHVAAGRGDGNVARFLLDTRAKIDARDDAGMTPLHFAAHEGRAPVAGMLLDAGADVNARCECPERDGGQTTPLMMASQGARIEVVRLLLQRGADASVASNDGWTALLLAADTCAIGGGEDLVRALMERGAEVDVRLRKNGVTALMRAQRLPCVGVARALLEGKADVNAKDKDGWTAVHYALQSRSIDAVRLLLEHGASLQANVALPDGTTPSQWIESNLKGDLKSEMAELLRQQASSRR